MLSIFRIFIRYRFTIAFIPLFSIASLQTNQTLSLPRTVTTFQKSLNNPIKASFVGQIIGHSYIKVSVQSTDDENSYTNAPLTPLKGTYFEAVSGKKFKLIGSYNNNTFLWKLDCFDNNNVYTATFLGKEDSNGDIQGKWTLKRISYNFYLKKVSKSN